MPFGLEQEEYPQGDRGDNTSCEQAFCQNKQDKVIFDRPSLAVFEAQNRLSQHTCVFQGCMKLRKAFTRIDRHISSPMAPRCKRTLLHRNSSICLIILL